jgi:CheY-like chemotaxis protein
MTRKLNCIMLIDDNPDDNFYHERVIRKSQAADQVIAQQSAEEALSYLRSATDNCPDLIFLDINMPGMNGWEFLQEYGKLDKRQRCSAIVVMLTTSENTDDKNRALKFNVDFKTKPLTKEMIEDVVKKHL